MASTAATYSKKKKKSFLPSIGSRRRLQDAIDHQQNLDRVVTMSAFHSGSQQKKLRVVGSKHHDSIDEMASALLDSPINEQPTSTPPSGTSGQVLPFLIGNDSDAGVQVHYPPDIVRRLRSRGVEKIGPGMYRKASKRQVQVGNWSPQEARARRKRPLPKSQTGFLNPLAHNPTKLPPSTSVNLGALAQLEGHTPQPILSQSSWHNDINQKMEQMLAATQALKPSASDQENDPPSGPSMMSRLKNKVAHAFQKSATRGMNLNLRSKSTAALEQIDDEGANLELAPLALPQLQLPPQEAPKIASLEIRLNEGKNLNLKKVQKMTGGRIRRKPLPEDGKSLRSRKSLDDDPFEERTVTKTPTQFECRLRDSYRSNDSYVPPLPSANPFETEMVMDSSVDAILLSPPLASSTPRLKGGHSHSFSCSDTPTKKRCTESITLEKGGPSISSLPALEASSPERGQDTSLEVTSKKHPSPTKDQLEIFSAQVAACADVFDPIDDSGASPKLKAKKRSSVGRGEMGMCSRRLTTCPSLPHPGFIADALEQGLTKKHPSTSKDELKGLARHVKCKSSAPSLDADIDMASDARTKKHPSPSKQELNALATHIKAFPRPDITSRFTRPGMKQHPTPSTLELAALQNDLLPILAKGRTIPEDKDELANSFNGSVTGSKTTSVLTTRDTNRHVSVAGAHASPVDEYKTGSQESKSPSKSSVSKVTTHSRIPRRTGHLTKSRTTALAVQFHHIRADPLAVDELQWDSPRYLVGHAAQVH